VISHSSPNDSINQQVALRRVQVVTRGARTAAYMLFAVACSLFGIAISADLPLWHNLGFFGAFVGLLAVRANVIGGFRSDRAVYIASQAQQKKFGICTLALGFCWAAWIVSAWQMPVESQVVVFSLVTATSFVAVGTLAVYPKWHSYLVGPPLVGLMVMQGLNGSFSLFFVAALGVAQLAMTNYMLIVHKKAIDNSILGSLRQTRFEQRFEAMFASGTNAIMVTQGSEIVRISSAVRDILKLSPDSTVIDIRHGLRLHSEHLTRLLNRVENRLSETGLVSANVRFWLPSGQALWVNIQGRLFDPIDYSKGIVWHLVDATKRREEIARNQYLAHHDALTNLLNRAGLLEKLFSLTKPPVGGRQAEAFALVNLDLDGFKAVNDTYGHLVGDAVLRVVAQRLQRTMRSGDFIARAGGDEFIVVLTDTHAPLQVAQATEKIVESLSKPIVIDKRKIEIGVSVGYSIWPTDGSDIESLLRLADINMYTAKQTSRNAYRRALTGLI
jgi:diguanylate cyclase (GGDEF)-like protein